MNKPQTPARLLETSYHQEWRDFVDVNGRVIFQIALLLSGGAHPAENALIASLEDLDVSLPPGKDDLAAWRRAVVRRSVRTADWFSAADRGALSMVQPELRPVMQIAGRSRICFVLRMLLGYTAPSCAEMLDIDDTETTALLKEAVVHLGGRS